MGEELWVNAGGAPTVAPLISTERDDQEHWRHFDNSVNAVSFGFVATAVLISMFLVMAIFERFLRPTSTSITPSAARRSSRPHLQGFNTKLHYPSPKTVVYAREVSVLMPGEKIPTYIAHPAAPPAPCPREGISLPLHQPPPAPHHHHHHPSLNPSSSSSSFSS
ncbi:uncharacterized protein LOC131149709 [Malania oleifera]|uniref:uncharacterized protein LOC131149709 n=1 Tax=Malania oleifera TaxID=397392 RepID=UPI0025AEAAA5|nr:uncharacterized protein LOC131149709 [Malania oleifera]